jgi:hypothetical protein
MKFYRYEAVQYAVMDESGEYTNSHFPNPKLEIREYDLLKETPKGYWIGYLNQYGVKIGHPLWQKWISKTSKKKFAYPTKEEALINFIKRTERRIRILDNQLTACKISLNIAKQKYEIQST